MFRAGLDWANETHAICVIDANGKRVLQAAVQHTADGLAKMLRRLTRIAPSSELPIAIERPTGLIVDFLVNAGYPVVPIHPNALKASRSRYSAAGGKSDPGDAYILADLLRTDGHRFRTLEPQPDQIRALRALVRSRDDLLAQRTALSNQLTALLESFWPGPAALFASINSSIALAFLKRYPKPSAARRLGTVRMANFLKRHRYPGRRGPEELVARLRAAPVGLAGPLEETSKGVLVKAWADLLLNLVTQLRQLTGQIERAVARLPEGRVLMSFPRAGKLNAAQILAELGSDPARFPTEAQLAAEAGVAPVTYASGRHRGVAFRFACNKRLRNSITIFANNSRRESKWANHVYAKARARGCRHPHAVRILARAWVRVLWKAWTEGLLYDLEKHHSAARLEHA